jgi:hypothetical protein
VSAFAYSSAALVQDSAVVRIEALVKLGLVQGLYFHQDQVLGLIFEYPWPRHPMKQTKDEIGKYDYLIARKDDRGNREIIHPVIIHSATRGNIGQALQLYRAPRRLPPREAQAKSPCIMGPPSADRTKDRFSIRNQETRKRKPRSGTILPEITDMEICFTINGTEHCYTIPEVEMALHVYRPGIGPINYPPFLYDATVLASIQTAADKIQDEDVRGAIRSGVKAAVEALQMRGGAHISRIILPMDKIDTKPTGGGVHGPGRPER